MEAQILCGQPATENAVIIHSRSPVPLLLRALQPESFAGIFKHLDAVWAAHFAADPQILPVKAQVRGPPAGNFDNLGSI